MTWLKTIAGRIAAVLLLILVLAPIAIAGLWAYGAYAQGEAERRDKLEQFDRLRAIAAYGAGSGDSAPPETPSRFLLGAGTQAVLTSGLQAKLRETAAKMGVDVLQASELEPETVDGLTRLGIRLEMVGPMSGVHALIQRIDGAEPWLFVRRLELQTGFAAGNSPAAEPPLNAAIEVWGLAEAPASEVQP